MVTRALAEEMDEAFTVPFEAAVAFVFDPVAAVGAAAVATTPVERLEASELSGFSAEKSSANWLVSIDYVIEVGTYQPAVDRAKLQTQILPTTESCIHRRELRPICPVRSDSSCPP